MFQLALEPPPNPYTRRSLVILDLFNELKIVGKVIQFGLILLKIISYYKYFDLIILKQNQTNKIMVCSNLIYSFLINYKKIILLLIN